MGRIRSFMLIVILLVPLPAFAVEADDIVAQLRAQGFSQINVSRTFLGRVKIEAQAPNLHREIVLNPKTGEILRDYTDAADSDSRYAGSDRTTSSGSVSVDSGLTSPPDVGTSAAVDAGASVGTSDLSGLDGTSTTGAGE
ncbi:hypothetical protein ACTTAI_13975 [Rhodobacter capsulatus]|uniref:hypothetical protein n=1 Tax=Rhodobacter capsulatus TaxID=1061 RepID=UPI0040289B71